MFPFINGQYDVSYNIASDHKLIIILIENNARSVHVKKAIG